MDSGAQIKDQYTVIEHIGRGGMADVWSARDQRLSRMVAIKTIARGLTHDPEDIERFKQEAQTIAQLEHPHILPVHDFGEYQGRLYIVMRYVTGGSLADALQVSGAMPPAEVLSMGRQIAQALDYAHQNNVIHLDLKPGNILLDSMGTPYLADFGLATALDPEGRARNPGAGTLLYMAPEQFMSELIDRRADLYSFALVLFHMLTGRLPFDVSSPLAVRQIQYQDQIPDLLTFKPDLPPELTDILRAGTAQFPDDRPDSARDLIREMRAVIAPERRFAAVSLAPEVASTAAETEPMVAGDAALREAVDLYNRARQAWSGGQGRFLLGVTHFMLISDYYRQEERYRLQIDTAGYQMLLRGALEYDVALEYWWDQLNDENRRWVCLHALRSGNAPARIRAIYRLETLPDDEKQPVIPRSIAQALEVETDEQARLAALQVLGTRASLLKPQQRVDIQTAYQGRLLNSLTRLTAQLRVQPHSGWLDAVYSPEIDERIARQALDASSPPVMEAAGRTIGRMRSLAALRILAEEQRAGRPHALQAMAFVRDESAALPDLVPPQARAYTWLTNTVRRLAANPLEGVTRAAAVMLGGWIGMGELVWVSFRSEALLASPRWANTIGFGLIFALFVMLTVLLSDEFSRRLRGFWTWPSRLLVFGSLGVLAGVLTWAAYTWLFLDYVPEWELTRFTGSLFALGFIIAALLDFPAWLAVPYTAAMAYLPLLLAHQSYYEAETFSIVPVGVVGLVTGAVAGWWADWRYPLEGALSLAERPLLRSVIAVGLGAVCATLVWLVYGYLFSLQAAGPGFGWDAVLLLLIATVLVGLVAAYMLPRSGRLAFFGSGLLVFGIYTATAGWVFSDQWWVLPLAGVPQELPMLYHRGAAFGPARTVPMIYWDPVHLEAGTIYTTVLPMVFVISLGAYLPMLLRRWWQWVGAPRQAHERDTWQMVTLAYGLVLSGIASVLALFSMHVSIPWGLGWSAWAFVTFVFTLASWRRARWGARALIVSLLLFLAGGLVFDAVSSLAARETGRAALWFRPDLLRFWGVWTAALGVFAWGAYRRRLWGGIGLVTMIAGWYIVAIATTIPGSMAVFALSHAALVCYALAPALPEMEPDRLPRFWRLTEPAAPAGVPRTAAARTGSATRPLTEPGSPPTQPAVTPEPPPTVVFGDDPDAEAAAEIEAETEEEAVDVAAMRAAASREDAGDGGQAAADAEPDEPAGQPRSQDEIPTSRPGTLRFHTPPGVPPDAADDAPLPDYPTTPLDPPWQADADDAQAGESGDEGDADEPDEDRGAGRDA